MAQSPQFGVAEPIADWVKKYVAGPVTGTLNLIDKIPPHPHISPIAAAMTQANDDKAVQDANASFAAKQAQDQAAQAAAQQRQRTGQRMRVGQRMMKKGSSN